LKLKVIEINYFGTGSPSKSGGVTRDSGRWEFDSGRVPSTSFGELKISNEDNSIKTEPAMGSMNIEEEENSSVAEIQVGANDIEEI
jgi:hypothetical protein